MSTASLYADREIIQQRVYDAPRDLVYEAWTRPDYVDRWFGPRGFVSQTTAMDVRPGGEWHWMMRSAEHGDFPNRARYREVVPGERLVYDHDAGVDDDPKGFHVTVTFVSIGAKTEVTMRCRFTTAAAREAANKYGAVEGGQQTMARLAEALDAAGAGDLTITRTVAAPRDRVWAAWTDPAQLGEWWGPKGLGLEVRSFDLRPGGLFHYAMIPPGAAPPMFGRFQFREIVAPERLVWINSFADAQGAIVAAPMVSGFPLEILNVLTLTEVDGHTTLNLRGRPIRASDEEHAFYAGMHASMRGGFGGTLDQLDGWLARSG